MTPTPTAPEVGNAAKSIIYDVWGGECSMEHIARYAASVEDAAAMMSADLSAGYLVNLRQDLAWGGEDAFDERGGAA
jgi:hypothetical protein